jgi:nucleotide-binding universal stress UspA family protein
MVIPRVGDVELAEQLRREREAYRRSDVAQLERVLGALPYALRGGVRVAEGDPGNALIEVASEYDLIAVGSEGRTGVTRLLLGSVAESVVRGARVTALVFPPAEGH